MLPDESTTCTTRPTSGLFTGSAWYTFSTTLTECAADATSEDRNTYLHLLNGPFSFCCHAFVDDA